jgi:hypothetical protein
LFLFVFNIYIILHTENLSLCLLSYAPRHEDLQGIGIMAPLF